MAIKYPDFNDRIKNVDALYDLDLNDPEELAKRKEFKDMPELIGWAVGKPTALHMNRTRSKKVEPWTSNTKNVSPDHFSVITNKKGWVNPRPPLVNPKAK
jgi:hypothetical protein